MLRVNVKTGNNLHLNIPVPYMILRAAGFFLTSETLIKQLIKAANKHAGEKPIPLILLNEKLPKLLFKELLRELSNQKGLVLVDAKLKDGTEVSVRL